MPTSSSSLQLFYHSPYLNKNKKEEEVKDPSSANLA